MKTKSFCVVLCFAFEAFAGRCEASIEGLYGVMLGDKPGSTACEIGGALAQSLNVRLVVLPNMKREGRTLKCMAILDDTGAVVAIQGTQADVETYGEIVARLSSRFGEPAKLGTELRVFSSRYSVDSVVFRSGDRALSLTRFSDSPNEFIYGCYDVTAMTKILDSADEAASHADRCLRKAISVSIGYEAGISKWNAPAYEIGKDDVAWKLRIGSSDVIVVSDGAGWWVLKDGKWNLVESRSESTFSFDGVCFKMKGRGVRRTLHRKEGIDGGDMQPVERIAATSLDDSEMPPPYPVVGDWIGQNDAGRVIKINPDNTLVWRDQSRSQSKVDEKWRWKYRFQRLVAIPEDFEPEMDSYQLKRAIMSISQDRKKLEVYYKGDKDVYVEEARRKGWNDK